MAQRTSTTLVEARLNQDWDGTSSAQQDIDAATLIVDRVAACARAKGKALSTAELEMVERLLACHFYKYSADRQYDNRNEQGAVVTGKFTGMTALENLSGTTYGQSAQMVDYSGCLAAISRRATASMFWLGKTPSEQTPFWQRD